MYDKLRGIEETTPHNHNVTEVADLSKLKITMEATQFLNIFQRLTHQTTANVKAINEVTREVNQFTTSITETLQQKSKLDSKLEQLEIEVLQKLLKFLERW